MDQEMQPISLSPDQFDFLKNLDGIQSSTAKLSDLTLGWESSLITEVALQLWAAGVLLLGLETKGA
jgi:hypothetical protein